MTGSQTARPLLGTTARLCGAVVLVALLLVAELGQRQGPAPAAAAHMPPVPVVAMQALVKLDSGTIPMPQNTPSAHASNLLAMPLGSPAALTAFWFAGTRESAPDVQIAASQWHRATGQWLPARFVVDRHALGHALGFGVRRMGNPVAWMDSTGRMHLFVVATGLGGWAAARVAHLVQSSKVHDLTQLSFTPVRVLPLSWLWNTSHLVRSAPLPLADGGMVLPAYFELGIKYPVALRFDALGNFVGMVRMSNRKNLLQPSLIALSPTRWQAMLRTSASNASISVVQSDDGGAHWRDMPALPLVNPDAAVAALSLSAQQHVLVHNTSPHSRVLLDLSASSDGAHWSLAQPLAHGTGADEFSYPALAWADDSLWVSYTEHRTHIAWQRFRAP